MEMAIGKSVVGGLELFKDNIFTEHLVRAYLLNSRISSH